MTVTVYRSTQASAPVLTTNVGALIALLDACLVNGYGSMPPAGWTKPFSGTNLAAYRQPSGNQFYLSVNDTTTSLSVVAGYESMTGVSTGTNRFPTAAQLVGGGWWAKSTQAAGIAVPWILVATQTLMYLWINVNNTTLPVSSDGVMYSFGDITSYFQSDAYATQLTGNYSNANSVVYCQFGAQSSTVAGVLTGQYFARPYTQTGTSVGAGRFTDLLTGSANGYMGYSPSVSNRPAFPEPVAGNLLVSPIWLTDSGCVRGVQPGMWIMSHFTQPTMSMVYAAAGPNLTFTQGPLSGKTIEGLQVYNSMVWVETSNTW